MVSNTFTAIAESANITGIETHRHLGEKRYEIKDHLGNVRAVVSDIKNADDYSISATSWKFLADVRSMSNYYPYGMEIEAGSWSGGDYNYGYNGMLKEGIGKDIYNTHFRNLSTGGFVGWWSPDPLEAKFPNMSTYATMGNNPINYIDSRGDSAYSMGSDNQRALLEMQKDTPNLNITENIITNQVVKFEVEIINGLTKGDLNFKERMIYDALVDDEINVNLFTGAEMLSSNKKTGDYIEAGKFGGKVLNSKTKKVETYQFLNYKIVDALEKNKYISNSSEVTSHELLESYFSAKYFEGDYLLSHQLANTVLEQTDINFSHIAGEFYYIQQVGYKVNLLLFNITLYEKIYSTKKSTVTHWDPNQIEEYLINGIK